MMTKDQRKEFWRQRAIENSKPPIAHWCFFEPDLGHGYRERMRDVDYVYRGENRFSAFDRARELAKNYGGRYMVLPEHSRLPVASLDWLFRDMVYHRGEYPERDELRAFDGDEDWLVDDESLKKILSCFRVGGEMGIHYPKALDKGVPLWHNAAEVKAVETSLGEYGYDDIANFIIAYHWKGSGSVFGVKYWGDEDNCY